MTCQWCEENEDIISLCKIEDHLICSNCYEQYQHHYPTRVKGCPYCKGIEEIPINIQPSSSSDTVNLRVVPRSSESTNAIGNCCCLCLGSVCIGFICAKVFIPLLL